MEMIRFYCQKCGARMKAPEHAAGRQSKCAKCGALNIVPLQSDVNAELEAHLSRVKRGEIDETIEAPDRNDESSTPISETIESMLSETDENDESSETPSPPPTQSKQPEVSGILAGAKQRTWDAGQLVQDEPADETEISAVIQEIDAARAGSSEAGATIKGEFIDQRMMYVLIGIVVIVILMGLFVVIPRAQREGPEPEFNYFLDTSTGELFSVSSIEPPPVSAPSGGVGLRAYVFSCESCDEPDSRFVGYVERFTREARIKRREALERIQMGFDDETSEILLAESETGRFIRRPDEAQWYAADSPEATAIMESVKCPRGSGTPQPCQRAPAPQ